MDTFFAEPVPFETKLWRGLLYTFFGLGVLATMAAIVRWLWPLWDDFYLCFYASRSMFGEWAQRQIPLWENASSFVFFWLLVFVCRTVGDFIPCFMCAACIICVLSTSSSLSVYTAAVQCIAQYSVCVCVCKSAAVIRGLCGIGCHAGCRQNK